jgi:hypothetical protein
LVSEFIGNLFPGSKALQARFMACAHEEKANLIFYCQP